MQANTARPLVNSAVMTGRVFWDWTTNSGICLQATDNVWVQRCSSEIHMKYEQKLWWNPCDTA